MHALVGLRRWQATHPLLADSLLAVAVFVGILSGPLADRGHGHGLDLDRGPVQVFDALTVVLFAVAAGALVLRRSRPLEVWGVALLAAVLIVVHHGDPTAAVVPSLGALYTVGTRTRLRTTVLSTAASAVVYAGAVSVVEGEFSDRTLSLLAFIGAAAAVGVAVRSQRAAVESAEARAAQAEATREEEAVRRVTDERVRIARELHDIVAHHISVINVQAGVARHLLTEQPDQARTALGLVREASRTVLTEMSTVLGLLRTGEDELPVEPAPGLAQVPAVVATMEQAGLRTTWRVAGEAYALSELADLTAYRVVQESLTNALKHGTGSADLTLDFRPDAVVVEVRNPVESGAPPSATGGHGLVGMRERVASVDGRLSVGSGSDDEFTVHVEIPRRPVA